jgi:hypothetical protein
MDAALFFNDFDLSTPDALGAGVIARLGARVPALEGVAASSLGDGGDGGGGALGLGALAARRSVSAGARRIQVPVYVKAPTAAGLNAAIERLRGLVPLGAVHRVRLGFSATRELLATRQGDTVEYGAPELTQRDATVTVTFEALAPAWQATACRVVGAQALAAAAATAPIPLEPGGAPVPPLLRLTGGNGSSLTTSATLTYRDALGRTRASLILTLGAAVPRGEWLEIDMARSQITVFRSAAGFVGADVSSWRTGGDFFGFDPRDGDPDEGLFPTLDVQAGGGGVQWLARWRALFA